MNFWPNRRERDDKEQRSFRIDLHVHTLYSGDSDTDPEEAVQVAIEAGLQGIAFTEHYSYEASDYVRWLRERYGGDILILRGVEFSAAEGHCLVFGVNTDMYFHGETPAEEVVRIVTRCGGVVIPTHPYRGMNSMGDVIRDLRGFAAIEGCNGCNLKAYNEMAIDAARVLNLPFTGGSDAHGPREVGACYTEFRDEVTYDNFVDLLRAGNFRGVDRRKVSRGWVPW